MGEIIERETFLAALELTDLLRGLGLKEGEVRRLTETFKRLDEKRLYEDYQYCANKPSPTPSRRRRNSRSCSRATSRSCPTATP